MYKSMWCAQVARLILDIVSIIYLYTKTKLRQLRGKVLKSKRSPCSRKKQRLEAQLKAPVAVNCPFKYTKELRHSCEMGTGCVPVVRRCLLLNNLIFGV